MSQPGTAELPYTAMRTLPLNVRSVYPQSARLDLNQHVSVSLSAGS